MENDALTLSQLLLAYYSTCEDLHMAQFTRQFIQPKKQKHLYIKAFHNIMRLGKEARALAERIEGELQKQKGGDVQHD